METSVENFQSKWLPNFFFKKKSAEINLCSIPFSFSHPKQVPFFMRQKKNVITITNFTQNVQIQ